MSLLIKTIKKILNERRNDLSQGGIPGLLAIDQIHQQEGGNIICFLAASEGDALAQLTREFIQPIADSASRVLYVNLNNPDWLKRLGEALTEPIWFAFAPFGIGQAIDLNVTGEHKNLWEAAKIPFVRVYGDIPAYFPDKHIGKYSNSINAYYEPSHAEFYLKWFEDKALTVLLPPIPIEMRSLLEIDEVAKRKGKIIFPKNGNSPEALIDYWRMALPSSMARALGSIVEECLSKENINREPHIDDRLLQYYENMELHLSVACPVLCFMVAQIDDYLRRYKSALITQSILDLPVIIRGKNWEHISFSGKKAIYDQNSDFGSTRTLIDEAPAIIDMSPNSVRAPHDRIYRAVGRGTAFLTNQNEYMPKSMSVDTGYTFLFERNSIHDLVEHYVLHPNDAINLGISQARAFRELYTPEKQCEALLSAVQAMSFKLGGRPIGTQNFVDFPPQEFR
jgi:hypothetical protein